MLICKLRRTTGVNSIQTIVKYINNLADEIYIICKYEGIPNTNMSYRLTRIPNPRVFQILAHYHWKWLNHALLSLVIESPRSKLPGMYHVKCTATCTGTDEKQSPRQLTSPYNEFKKFLTF